MANASLLILEDGAAKLRDLLDEVVFVGGATLGLLVTDPGTAPVRPTIDVDVIAEIATAMEYFDFTEKLRSYGFREDLREGAPVCRWLNEGLVLDLMPIDESILGFGNRWYKDALQSAVNMGLPSGKTIRVISAVYFLGTKLEAFRGRGNQDFYGSRDLEDVVSVLDGRATILDEIDASPSLLHCYIAEAIHRLLSEPRFLDALPGYLLPDQASQERLPDLLHKLNSIARSRWTMPR